jgi:hypothetical protein
MQPRGAELLGVDQPWVSAALCGDVSSTMLDPEDFTGESSTPEITQGLYFGGIDCLAPILTYHQLNRLSSFPQPTRTKVNTVPVA